MTLGVTLWQMVYQILQSVKTGRQEAVRGREWGGGGEGRSDLVADVISSFPQPSINAPTDIQREKQQLLYSR